MLEHDLPICRVWQIGSRARLQLMVGEWDDALGDADRGAGRAERAAGPDLAAPHSRAGGPAQARAGRDSLDEAWQARVPVRRTDPDAARRRGDRRAVPGDGRHPTIGIAECRELLAGGPIAGLEWSRGELAVWLRRLGDDVDVDRRGRAVPVGARRRTSRRQPMSSTGFRCRTTRRWPWSTPATPRSPHGRSTCSTGSAPTRSRPRSAAICGRRACPRCPRAGARRRWPIRPV